MKTAAKNAYLLRLSAKRKRALSILGCGDSHEVGQQRSHERRVNACEAIRSGAAVAVVTLTDRTLVHVGESVWELAHA